MFPAAVMSSSSSISGEATCISCSSTRVQEIGSVINPFILNTMLEDHQLQPQKSKKKRNLPGNPDPDAEVIALSPSTLLATNRFVCEVCNKGFQRDQNLQLHRRGHNLPWKLKQRNGKEAKKRVYVCPDPACIHHHPSRALGDLTGIKKHFCRKHGEKKWKCEKCSKVYAVQSDWKAHSKTCGTREYRCDCGTIFSRKDSFITHRAFCDALAEESARLTAATNTPLFAQLSSSTPTHPPTFHFNHPPPPPSPSPVFPFSSHHPHFPVSWDPLPQNPNPIKYENPQLHQLHINPLSPYQTNLMASPFHNMLHVGTTSIPPLSATALLQRAASVGASGYVSSTMANLDMHASATWQKSTNPLTRDFMGLTEQCGGSEDDHGGGSAGSTVEMIPYTGGVEYQSLMNHNNNQVGFGFVDHQPCSETAAAWGDS